MTYGLRNPEAPNGAGANPMGQMGRFEMQKNGGKDIYCKDNIPPRGDTIRFTRYCNRR